MWKLYSLLRHITSDVGSQFASKLVKELNQKLNINLCLSTVYHRQTDALSEHAVQTLMQYLHIYYHDGENCWRAWLPVAGFAYNTTATMTHKLWPYRSLYGFDSWSIHLNDNYKLLSPTIEEWLNRITTVHNHIHNVYKRINHK